uniref:RNA-dependent RNA polymerase subunit PA n=1 Tax=Soybean thrips thogotovirus 1 TaxID=2797871 RepID=A0A7T8ASB3_9ORTO|nr:RNA-dependent RNA polymerase subunit PA [Soybean thrips thogotovirus 1]
MNILTNSQDLIEPALLNEVLMSRSWPEEEWKELKIFSYAIHYKVLALIRDQYTTPLGMPEWSILELLPRTNASNLYRRFIEREPIKSIPDIINVTRKIAYEVTITNGDLMTAQEHKLEQVNEGDVILVFHLEGRCNQNAMDHLNEEQRQTVFIFLNQVHGFLENLGILSTYSKYVTQKVIPEIKIGSKFKARLLKDTDFPFLFENIERGENPRTRAFQLLRSRAKDGKSLEWKRFPELPTFALPNVEEEADYSALFLSKDSIFVQTEVVSDSAIFQRFTEGHLGLEVLEQGNLTLSELSSFEMSVASALQTGDMNRKIVAQDARGFGIGKKNKNTRTAEGTYKSNRSEPVPKSPPTWMGEELMECISPSMLKWCNFERNQTYKKIDEIAEEMADRYCRVVERSFISAMIERNVETSTKIEVKIMEDRERITIIPITTRKDFGGKQLCQVWGFLLVGPSHPKKSTDKIPLMIIEFCPSTLERGNKYRRYSKVKFIFAEEERIALARKTSTTRQKIFYMTGLRKCHLQPCNIFSKIVFKEAADQDGVYDPIKYRPIKLFWFDGTEQELDFANYLRLILSLEYFMAIYNNSQLEAFCANIRRLHMCRHALQERKKIYTLPSGDIAEPVQESILNNPVVLFLAETWNMLPINY